jgi:hypothetical protein
MIGGFWMLTVAAIYALGMYMLVAIIRRHIGPMARPDALAHCGDDDYDWSWFGRRKPPVQAEPTVELGGSYRGPPAHTKPVRPPRLRLSWIKGVAVGVALERSDNVTIRFMFLVFELRVKLTRKETYRYEF